MQKVGTAVWQGLAGEGPQRVESNVLEVTSALKSSRRVGWWEGPWRLGARGQRGGGGTGDQAPLPAEGGGYSALDTLDVRRWPPP